MAIQKKLDVGKFKKKLEDFFKVDVKDDIIKAIYLGAQDIVNAATQQGREAHKVFRRGWKQPRRWHKTTRRALCA